MSANLALNAAGEAMVAYRGETPWHKQGVKVSDDCTGLEMLKAASLDFNVVESPVYAVVNGAHVEIPDQKATLRGDTNEILGVVGKDYKVYQNQEMISFFEGLVQGHKIQYETAGALGNGERVWVLARIPDLSCAIKGDELVSYMAIRNGHDGSLNLSIHPTMTRIVCQNTLRVASAEFVARGKKYGKNNVHAGYKIRHTKNMHLAVAQVQAAYGKCLEDIAKTKELYQILADRTVTDTEVRDYFLKMIEKEEEAEKVEKEKASKLAEIRRQNRMDLLIKIWNSPTNQTGTKGTAFALLNTMVEFADYFRPTRCAEGKQEDACRFESAMFGSGQNLKDRALTEAMALV